MRALLFAISILVCTTYGITQVQFTSFYFKGNSEDLTSYSEEQLLILLDKMDTMSIQLIEVNAFNPSGTKQSGLQLNCILKRLETDDEETTVNNYGSKRVVLNFKPANWNRVDVYYSWSTAKEREPKYILVPRDDTIRIKMESVPRPEPEKNDGAEKLAIGFIGGKSKMTSKSKEALDELYDRLKSNPDLTAHIRGHVCCGPNKRISKNRARAVYKEMVKRGIDKKRLTFAGYSNSKPIIFPEKTRFDRETNRRVDILFE